MRTLITLSLILFLSFYAHGARGGTPAETQEVPNVTPEKPPELEVDLESCPGYIKGNHYTYCTDRSYVVHESGRLALQEALEKEKEEEEEAEE